MATLDGLIPEFRTRLAVLLAEAGPRLRLNYGYRSRQEQQRLYDLWLAGPAHGCLEDLSAVIVAVGGPVLGREHRPIVGSWVLGQVGGHGIEGELREWDGPLRPGCLGLAADLAVGRELVLDSNSTAEEVD